MMFVDCSAMSFCKKIVCFLTPRQVLRKGLLGLFLAGFALLAGSVWAEAINTESATAKYVAPFEMAASQAAASPRQHAVIHFFIFPSPFFRFPLVLSSLYPAAS